MIDKPSRLNTQEKITASLFLVVSVWWAILYFVYDTSLLDSNLFWAATYQILAIWGGIYGLISSRTWGGFRSWMGRAIIFFSLSLLLQSFGQTAFSYYNIFLQVEIPYPSIADIGYFGSVLVYILGVASLMKVSGASLRWREIRGKIQILTIPIIILITSYLIFLRGYEFDPSAPLRTFLDFGYPLGEAIYVSIALLVLFLSRKILGGIMKQPLVFLLIALFIQYCSDFNFLYQASKLTWINGGYGDYLYALSYFLMAISLIKIDRAIHTHKQATYES